MRSFQTRRHVAHSAEAMFALTADVERYPEFVPLCRALTVRSRQRAGDSEIVIADMTVAYRAFAESFTSRVVLTPPELTIETSYLEGPFRHMNNCWRFEPQGAGACVVDFSIEYEFRSLALQLAAGAVFDRAFGKFAQAFEARADALHGASRRVG